MSPSSAAGRYSCAMTKPSRLTASIIWFRFGMSSSCTRKTPVPPEPCSGFRTQRPSSLAKALISSRSRVISVRGRTSSGNNWKYILVDALARPFGSLTTITPCASRHGQIRRRRSQPKDASGSHPRNVAEHQHVEIVDGHPFLRALLALQVGQ